MTVTIRRVHKNCIQEFDNLSKKGLVKFNFKNKMSSTGYVNLKIPSDCVEQMPEVKRMNADGVEENINKDYCFVHLSTDRKWQLNYVNEDKQFRSTWVTASDVYHYFEQTKREYNDAARHNQNQIQMQTQNQNDDLDFIF